MPLSNSQKHFGAFLDFKLVFNEHLGNALNKKKQTHSFFMQTSKFFCKKRVDHNLESHFYQTSSGYLLIFENIDL